MLRKLVFLSVVLLMFGCDEEDQREREIAKIPVDFEVTRFDERFARATPDSLTDLKKEFPFLFPKQYPDSLWIQKMSDTIQRELDKAVGNKFPDFNQQILDLTQFFQHVKYYYPQTTIPDVITLTSEVDYRNQVIWADSLLLISLDTYLGPEHPLYLGVQDYIKKQMDERQLISDIGTAFSEQVVPRPESRNFLAQIVYYGKILYLKDHLLPQEMENLRIGYSPEELDWAKANEEQIWRYFVENELLYSADPELRSRFLMPAPFSKFYLQLDNEAPARLGQYIGWQIVRQYAEETENQLREVLLADAETIFEESNYKPKK